MVKLNNYFREIILSYNQRRNYAEKASNYGFDE